MRNLKRALSLALAAAMLISLMVVGASAASYGDADSIDNTDAVEFLTSLGVVGGDQNGNYNPDATLTRAEFCVMIANALTGGTFDRTLFEGTNTPFTDVANHWGAAYIAYCYSVGVIAGTSATTFSPDNTLTAAQASAILLSALGYNQNNEFGANGQFELNVTKWGQNAGLYKDLSVSATAGITRDQTAQLIYNAMNVATPVTYSSLISAYSTVGYGAGALSGTVVRGDTAGNYQYTLAHTVFGLIRDEGYVTGASYNSTTGKYAYTIDTDSTNPGYAALGQNDYIVYTTKDLSDSVALKVEVLYKVESNGDKTAYGLNSVGNEVTATVGELDLTTAGDAKIKLAGTEYELNGNDNAVAVYELGASAANQVAQRPTTQTLSSLDADPASTLTLVDSDKDGKYNYAVVVPVTVSKVTYVGTNGITAGGAYTYKDDVIESGLAKDDFVTILAAVNSVEGKDVISKVDTITGVISGVRSGSEVLVNGTWYKLARNAGDAVALNSTFTLAVIGGYYYNATKVDDSATMDTLLLATDKADVQMGLQQAKFLDSTGNTVVATVSKIGGDNVGTTSNEVAPGVLYTYKVKDGNYELTEVSATNNLGFTYVADDGAVKAKTNTAAAQTTDSAIYFTDDAVVFIKNTDTQSKTTWKTVTGADVNDWATNYGDSSEVLYRTINGVKYAVAAYVVEASGTIPAAKGEVDNYGYVVSEPYSIKENDTDYATYQIWDGTATVTVKDEDNDLTIKKGDIITYTDLGNGIIKDSGAVVGLTAVAVTGFTDTLFQAVKYDGTAITDTAITEDTVIMYVDSKAVAGVAGGSFELAGVQADGSRIMNAWTVGDSAGKAKLIVVEVNNDIESLANGSVGAAGGAAGLTVGAVSLTGSATNLTGILAAAKDLTYAVTGDEVTVTITASGAVTISGDGVKLTDGSTTTYATIAAGSYTDKQVLATFTIPATASATSITQANADA